MSKTRGEVQKLDMTAGGVLDRIAGNFRNIRQTRTTWGLDWSWWSFRGWRERVGTTAESEKDSNHERQ